MFSQDHCCFLSKRTLVQLAANDNFEPDLVIVVLCCERMQRENCGIRERLLAVAHRDKRPFELIL